jgi:hypothetical protein
VEVEITVLVLVEDIVSESVPVTVEVAVPV